MKLFHATDMSRVEPILKNGFYCKHSEDHWLGNGIYFYFDFRLAQWWATNPTSKFGIKITNSAILFVDISIDKSKILDLRTLDGYSECLRIYKEFNEYATRYLEDDVKHSKKKFRCSFFDYIFRSYEIDCIIGSFVHKNKAYLKSFPECDLDQMRLFDLPFAETQICVRQNIISPTDIKIIEE